MSTEENLIPPIETTSPTPSASEAAPEAQIEATAGQPGATPRKPRAPKKDELDFDNFEVPSERAKAIRSDLEKLRETNWLEDLRLLAAELGVEDPAIASALGGQMELIGTAKAKVYRGAAEAPTEGLIVVLNGSDLLVRYQDRTLLEVMQLPKAGEFAILQVDPTLWEIFPEIREALKDDLKTARQVKGDRQSKFKAIQGGGAA